MDHAATPARLKPAEFIQLVLEYHPKLAVFDCDGTLWAGDAGERFFDWELGHGLVAADVVRWARARYADYKAGLVDEETMCGELVTLHQGLLEADVQRAATEFFEENFVEQIFPEMSELIKQLESAGCEVWAVSSSNEWVIRAGMKHCGIAQERILATSVAIENGRITDQLVRVPSGPGKSDAIREVIRRRPDVAFGNARWDTEMLEMAVHGFAVNPNPDLEQAARAHRWKIYHSRPLRIPKS
jgi:HAD superfamily phosphoserine phosphatase-like hydrolase